LFQILMVIKWENMALKWFEINSKDLFDLKYNPTSRIDFVFVRRMRTQKKWDQRNQKRSIGNRASLGIKLSMGDDVAL